MANKFFPCPILKKCIRKWSQARAQFCDSSFKIDSTHHEYGSITPVRKWRVQKNVCKLVSRKNQICKYIYGCIYTRRFDEASPITELLSFRHIFTSYSIFYLIHNFKKLLKYRKIGKKYISPTIHNTILGITKYLLYAHNIMCTIVVRRILCRCPKLHEIASEILQGIV